MKERKILKGIMEKIINSVLVYGASNPEKTSKLVSH